MLLFIVMSLGVILVATIGVDWILDRLSRHNRSHRFEHDARMPKTNKEDWRAAQGAEYEKICGEIMWERAIRDWP